MQVDRDFENKFAYSARTILKHIFIFYGSFELIWNSNGGRRILNKAYKQV